MQLLYNYYFQFKDADGNYYKLRKADTEGITVRYRDSSSTDSFIETRDFNVDEPTNSLWVRLPESGESMTDIVFNLTVEPLRNVTTALLSLKLMPYTAGFEVTATPTPVNALQGFSPRIIDGYWHEFDDINQTFRNTGIKAEGTEITPGTVVDVVEPNNLNPVTSNAVYNSIIIISNNLEAVEENINNLTNIINSLNNKKIKVKLNDEIHEEDAFGNIDLGNIETSISPNTFYTTEREEVINGVLYPRGSAFINLDDGSKQLLATDSDILCEVSLSNLYTEDKSEFWEIFSTYTGAILEITHSQYMSSVSGIIYIERSGYNYRLITTSQEIADKFMFTSDGSGRCALCAKGSDSRGYVPRVKVKVTNGSIAWNPYRLPKSFNLNKLNELDIFLTSLNKDWIDIPESTYEQNPEFLEITNYLIHQSVEYTFTEPVNFPFSLTFKSMADNAIITAGDSNFESSSKELFFGDIATFIYNDSDTFSWEYSHEEKGIVTSVILNNEEHYPVNGVVDLGEAGGGNVDSVSVNGGTPFTPDENKNVDLKIDQYTLEITGGGNVDSVSVNGGEPFLPDENKNVDLEIPVYTLEITGGGQPDTGWKGKEIRFTDHSQQTIALQPGDCGVYFVTQCFGIASRVRMTYIQDYAAIIHFYILDKNTAGMAFLVNSADGTPIEVDTYNTGTGETYNHVIFIRANEPDTWNILMEKMPITIKI